MKTTICKNEFINSFRNSDYKNNFTVAGLSILFDYLEEMEKETSEEMEFDIIAIASDFKELTFCDILLDYSNLDFEDYFEALIARLEDETTVLKVNKNSYIIQEY